jgi:triacylglycerol lipase
MVVATLSSVDGRAETALLSEKEVPRITFENISPPFNQYDYFQNRFFFPFEYKASSFSLINAWWLAEASTLVYSDDAFAWQRLRQAGFEQIQFFERSGTYCFLAANGRFAIVAFRGSEIWKRGEHFDAQRILADMKTNIDIRLPVWTQGGRVHSGFKTALEEVWNMLRPEIERLQSHGIKIWLTGHSLGAALATLAADRLQDVPGLYTFGSPRVGDRGFQAHFHVPAYRVVNGKDIVASVPGKNPFRHVGELVWIDPDGGLYDHPDAEGKPDDPGCSEDANPSGDTSEGLQIDSGVLLPRAFRDHCPLLYTTLLWNALVERLDDGDGGAPQDAVFPCNAN